MTPAFDLSLLPWCEYHLDFHDGPKCAADRAAQRAYVSGWNQRHLARAPRDCVYPRGAKVCSVCAHIVRKRKGLTS